MSIAARFEAMPRSVFAASVAAIAITFIGTTSASATVGGPTMVEVLGYDVRDQKIYYVVVRSDSSDELPQVFFMHLDGAHAGKPQLVLSIKKGIDDHSENAYGRFEARLAKLRKRLAKIRVVATAKREGASERGDELPPAVKGVRTSRVRLGVKRYDDWEVECLRVRVTVRIPKTKLRAKTIVQECSGPARVTAIYSIKNRRERLVLLSSEPSPWEGGYEVQVPLLVRKP